MCQLTDELRCVNKLRQFCTESVRKKELIEIEDFLRQLGKRETFGVIAV
jgi:hypothetical protein